MHSVTLPHCLYYTVHVYTVLNIYNKSFNVYEYIGKIIPNISVVL